MTFAERVRDAFPDHADTVLGIVRGAIDPETFPSVAAWVRQCYNRPHMAELKLCALNEVLGGYGIEGACRRDCMRSGFSYVNFGDTYDTTVLLIREGDAYRWQVSSFGDYLERHGKHYD